MSKSPLIADAEARDFKQYLQAELVRRCRSNPRYSLRAFARQLEIGPSFLSMLLSGKRAMTGRSIDRLAPRLGLSPAVVQAFKASLGQAFEENTDADFVRIATDQLHLISDWCHYAILELVCVKRFQPNIPWVAKALGLSIHEAAAAVERLVRLGMLEIKPSGQWRVTSDFSTNIHGTLAISARRKLQRQILEKAMLSLDTVPMEYRDQSSMTMAIDISLLPEAKASLAKFRRSLMRLLQRSKKHDEVYNLSLSLYPLTNVSGRLSKESV